VHELLGIKEDGTSQDMLEIIELFKSGFEKYLAQNWDEAIGYFEKVLSVNKNDGPAKRYIQRCRLFKENPPGPEWDGVYTLTRK
ncbi:MAG: hypothetical protein P8X42_17770, partial [Calditrichaceae bacterium]